MFDASTLEVFIASTSDLSAARDAVENVLRDWNSRNGRARQIMLKPVRWEKDSTPQLGVQGGQDAINKQLLENADILVGIFGKRLGSKTEKSISGTVAEITLFQEAKKPVLLYFSDEPAAPSEIDPAQLKGVQKFRKSMQSQGLFQVFQSVDEFERMLRGHLDTVLQDFRPLLIPASSALGYGYFFNFVGKTYDYLRFRTAGLPDYGVTLNFTSARIRIADPGSLDDATDDAVVDFKQKCDEINICAPGGDRRAFRIYVRKGLADQLKNAANGKKDVTVEVLDLFDFPTPLIALNNFVQNMEHNLITPTGPGLGYWERQKCVQYYGFFAYLDALVKQKGLGRGYCTIERFEYRDERDFELPA